MTKGLHVIHDGGDISVTMPSNGHVAIVEIHRPPNNYFDAPLVKALVDVYSALDSDARCRAVLLCTEGKNFCAGANFWGGDDSALGFELYRYAVKLFEFSKPVVAAVQGAAVGGGVGLALAADLRMGTERTRFAVNFARLGIHHGFGLSVTLPAVVGQQFAFELLCTGRQVAGAAALQAGLLDHLVSEVDLRAEAAALCDEIAASAPLAISSIKKTLRGDRPALVRSAVAHEASEQARLLGTRDFKIGLEASRRRETPEFVGE